MMAEFDIRFKVSTLLPLSVVIPLVISGFSLQRIRNHVFFYVCPNELLNAGFNVPTKFFQCDDMLNYISPA